MGNIAWMCHISDICDGIVPDFLFVALLQIAEGVPIMPASPTDTRTHIHGHSIRGLTALIPEVTWDSLLDEEGEKTH